MHQQDEMSAIIAVVTNIEECAIDDPVKGSTD